MINEIETTDIKASYTVSRVLWTLLDTVFAGDNEEDALNLYDKELLDDILRFGTIAEVARRKGEPYNSVRTKVVQTLDRLEKKIKLIEIKAHQLSHDLENANSLLKVKDKKLNGIARIHCMEIGVRSQKTVEMRSPSSFPLGIGAKRLIAFVEGLRVRIISLVVRWISSVMALSR